jgi:hypothetical protein
MHIEGAVIQLVVIVILPLNNRNHIVCPNSQHYIGYQLVLLVKRNTGCTVLCTTYERQLSKLSRDVSTAFSLITCNINLNEQNTASYDIV